MSHKIRLALWSSAVVGVLLAALFAGLVFAARHQALAQKESELRQAMNYVSREADETFDPVEFREAHPELSAAVFDSKGNLVSASGGHAPIASVGFWRAGGTVYIGQRTESRWIVLGSPWRDVESGLGRLTMILAALWAPLTLLTGGATWLATRSVFRPLERLTRQAAEATGSHLGERLDTNDPAEFGQFAAQLNSMLDRLETTARREEEFVVDAAHELKTPLTILRAQIETTLIRRRTLAEYIASHEQLLTEVDRLSRLVESLLRSASVSMEVAAAIRLDENADRSVETWRERFAEKNVGLEIQATPTKVWLLEEEVRIILDNLLSNALRFSPPGTTVTVKVGPAGEMAELSVRDMGPGIRPDLREKVFERFFRVDHSRNRGSGGTGVGLAVCRRIIEARGGTIEVQNGSPGAMLLLLVPSSD